MIRLQEPLGLHERRQADQIGCRIFECCPKLNPVLTVGGQIAEALREHMGLPDHY
jgi:hypothetical protein